MSRPTNPGGAFLPGGVPGGNPLEAYLEEKIAELGADVFAPKGATEAALAGKASNTFLQDGTGAVERTKDEKLREWVSVKDFGAKGDNTGDDAAAIMAADAAVAALGGGVVYFPPGIYPVGSDIAPSSNVTWLGAGGEASKLKVPDGNTTRNRIIYHANEADPRVNVRIEGLAFEGQWIANKSSLNAGGLITLKAITGLAIERCSLRYSRWFSFNINECANVTIRGNLVRDSVRDGIAVWNSPGTTIEGNTLKGTDDDGISVNIEDDAVTPVRSRILIRGNILEDTLGIKVQAAKTLVIADNIITRPKGYGIWVGAAPASGNYRTPNGRVRIVDNTITDVIDRSYFSSGTASSDQARTYIRVDGCMWNAGGLAAVPGRVNSATGAVQSPYEYEYSTGGASNSDPIRSQRDIKVKGNICVRTLPAVAAYSDWGFGEAFTTSGYRNTAVSETMMRGWGIELRLPVENITITDNELRPGTAGIQISLGAGVTLTHGMARKLRIEGNQISDTLGAGISWPGSGSATYQSIEILNNEIDCDPNFLASQRAAGGAWTASGPPYAFNIPYLGGVMVRGNTVRNCAQVFLQTGASTVQQFEYNYLVADPAGANFNAANKGVGNIPPIGDGAQWWLIVEDCDPTSATYGQSLGLTPKNSSGIPTAGKWLAGMRVASRTSTISTGKVEYGWVRLTTGTSHVSGTDWTPVFVTTS